MPATIAYSDIVNETAAVQAMASVYPSGPKPSLVLALILTLSAGNSVNVATDSAICALWGDSLGVST